MVHNFVFKLDLAVVCQCRKCAVPFKLSGPFLWSLNFVKTIAYSIVYEFKKRLLSCLIGIPYKT